jgi:hypothetical protein
MRFSESSDTLGYQASAPPGGGYKAISLAVWNCGSALTASESPKVELNRSKPRAAAGERTGVYLGSPVICISLWRARTPAGVVNEAYAL